MSATHTTGGASTGSAFEKLRLDAEARLEAGADGPDHGWALDPDALSRLHRLASSEEHSADALKLLHELQTHQVELDIQYEQLQHSERQAYRDRLYYHTLFHSAPLGYLILGQDGHIIDYNEAATELLASRSDSLHGQPLESLLRPSRPSRLAAFLELPRHSHSACSCVLESHDESRQDDSHWQLNARLAPSGEAILLTVSRLDARETA
ncbi:MAG: PAS domain-containing protein [Oleiphilaceae bacterium]|nr:PAS domain-containing protein [Oleiphilaceae bacterium]